MKEGINNEGATETSFRLLEVGDRFRIVNENFSPRKVMPTVFTKLSAGTYSYERKPPRSSVIERLRSQTDDFFVVVVRQAAGQA